MFRVCFCKPDISLSGCDHLFVQIAFNRIELSEERCDRVRKVLFGNHTQQATGIAEVMLGGCMRHAGEAHAGSQGQPLQPFFPEQLIRCVMYSLMDIGALALLVTLVGYVALRVTANDWSEPWKLP